MANKTKRLNKLIGDVPFVYKVSTIYNMCILINALVDKVNFLADQVEELQKAGEDCVKVD